MNCTKLNLLNQFSILAVAFYILSSPNLGYKKRKLDSITHKWIIDTHLKI